ncbi:fibronectin type III domain-containing protein [Herbivorax sp. ANBcel31]|uniref:fibronectin type III domain-containing protein n=1 Tax=Herbivorax sp. ANBcel31 TaxID=3069754 RepID=UPI0027B1BCA0|nr:fibronectin type III domain-containing protein [Herbivorax sp. ANBcel31]MDQ2085047.1 fibronectin type III domain-containing protein [Herbivorax sp. ANBcel31]
MSDFKKRTAIVLVIILVINLNFSVGDLYQKSNIYADMISEDLSIKAEDIESEKEEDAEEKEIVDEEMSRYEDKEDVESEKEEDAEEEEIVDEEMSKYEDKEDIESEKEEDAEEEEIVDEEMSRYEDKEDVESEKEEDAEEEEIVDEEMSKYEDKEDIESEKEEDAEEEEIVDEEMSKYDDKEEVAVFNQEKEDSESIDKELSDDTENLTPQNLEIISKTSTTVNLSWTKPVDGTNISHYNVYDGDDIVKSVDAEDSVCTIDNLIPLTQYSFTVRSEDVEGNISEPTNEITIFTPRGETIIDSETSLTEDTVYGDLYIENDYLDLNGYKLIVEGDLIHSRGTLKINGGELIVKGDYRIQSKSVNNEGEVSYGNSRGYFDMTNSRDYVLIEGNFVTHTRYNHSDLLTDGLLEIKGDITQKNITNNNSSNYNFCPTGKHITKLNGEGLQTVSFESSKSGFNILKIENDSDEGVEFKSPLNTNKLNDNGNILKFAGSKSGIVGWELSEDEVYDGDLYLGGGDLNLNGHVLKVKGDLVQSGGVVDINGGQLYIDGDYRLQTEIENEEGNKSYTYSNGFLKMIKEFDYVSVEGEFVTHSQHSHEDYLINGILEVKGHFVQKSHYARDNFNSAKNHKVVLSGDVLQKVTFETSESLSSWDADSNINILEITNTSDEGVEFVSKLGINGEIKETSTIISGGKNLYLGGNAQINWDVWPYDLRIEENRILEKDMVIEGSLYVYRRSLNLNGHSLKIEGNLIQEGGTLTINGGELIVGGDYRIQTESIDNQENVVYGDSTGYLNMTNVNDYVSIEGTFATQTRYSHYDSLTAGVLKVGEDFIQKKSTNRFADDDNFYATDAHRTVLNGEALQMVSFETPQSRFSTLEIENYSEEGIEFNQALNADTFIDNGCKYTLPGMEVSGWELTEDEVHEGDLYLGAGQLNLNGYVLKVEGNLVQSGGTVNINGGSLHIEGDYRLQTKNEDDLENINYTYSNGRLWMMDENDSVKVEGDFINNSNRSHTGYLTNGVLELKGDFIHSTHDEQDNFRLTENHKVVLSGEELQKVRFEDSTSSSGYSCINILEITNTSEDGVEFESIVVVKGEIKDTSTPITGGRYLSISENTQINWDDWSYDIGISENYTLEDNIAINGSLFIHNRTLDLNGFSINIYGDFNHLGGTLNLNGGEVSVKGNYNIETEDNECVNANLRMTNEDDYIKVYGSFIMRSRQRNNNLTAGILEVKGDFTQKNGRTSWSRENFDASESHSVILSGEGKQNVSFESTESQFYILELKNYSEEGVEFAQALNADTFIDNGCKFTFPGSEVVGWTLTEDEVYEGDVYLGAGNLNLNGYSLTITGDLIQSGGTVDVRGGELYVQGDYRLQTKNENAQGNISFSHSSGYLKMANESDYIKVEGDFVTYSDRSHTDYLTNGVLEVKGDFTQKRNNAWDNFNAAENHKVILSGDVLQSVSFESSSAFRSYINNFEITNTSEEGVEFTSNVVVNGQMMKTSTPISGGKYLCLGLDAQVNWEYWPYDLGIEGSYDLDKDLVIGGSLYIHDGSLDLKGFSLIVEGDIIQTRGTLSVSGGYLEIKGSYIIESEGGEAVYASLRMTDEKDYIKVYENFVMNSRRNHSNLLTDGILEIKGDFIQKNVRRSDSRNFDAGGMHRVILSGEEKQVVTFQTFESRFNILELQNYSNEGVEFNDTLNSHTFIDNGCIFEIKGSQVVGWELTEDEVYDGNVYLAGGQLNLNGYTLTIKGDLIQSGGLVDINGGELYVNGDYKIQRENNEYSIGILKMVNESDYVNVKRDFVIHSNKSHLGYLTNGVLEVKRDFIQLEHSVSDNFRATGNHKLLLSGEILQKISFESASSGFYDSCINILEIVNTSDEGIEFGTVTVVNGELSGISVPLKNAQNLLFGENAKLNWNIWPYDLTIEGAVLENDLTIEGNLYSNEGTLNLNGYRLVVEEDFIHSDGTVDIVGGELIVKGNYRMQSMDSNGEFEESDSILNMTDEDDYVYVGGNFITQSENNHSNRLTEGVLEIKGHFSQKSGNWRNFNARDNHRTVLSGDNLQGVSFESSSSTFNILEVKNHSPEGIEFNENRLPADTFIDNGCVIKLPDSKVLGWELKEDQVYEGNLYLGLGELKLNGYSLTVTGDLIQSGGTLEVDGGELTVKGDYLMQSKNVNNEGEIIYTNSNGYLNMTNEEDYVFVKGDFVMQSSNNHFDLLTTGLLEIQGNFTQKTGEDGNFNSTESHRTVLSGEELQTISFDTSQSRFNILELKNHSKEGIVFKQNTLNAITLIDNDCKVSFPKEADGWKLAEDEIYEGDLYISSGILNLNGYNLTITGDLIQSAGIVDVSGGKLNVKGDYRIQTKVENEQEDKNYKYSNGILKMVDEGDYVKVEGNFITHSNKSHLDFLTNGVLELKGDFIQITHSERNNFKATNNHKLLLSGENLQKVSFDNSDYSNESCINILEIANTFEEGVKFISKVAVKGEIKETSTPITGGKYISIGENTKLGYKVWPGDLSIGENFKLENDITINGSLYVDSIYWDGTLKLNGYNLTVNENLIHSNGIVDIDGGELVVKGDFRIQTENVNEDGEIEFWSSGAYLNMTKEEDYILVEGDFITESWYSHSGRLTEGLLEIQGDFAQKRNSNWNFVATENHKTLLSGSGLQTVNFDSSDSGFNVLELQNYSDEGVIFNQLLNLQSFIDNECNFEHPGLGVVGWKLTEDEVYEGDLYLDLGQLDLNGNKLTIAGDLIQSGGKLTLGGGNLNVQGDYRLQTKNEDDEGNEFYTYSNGYLKMVDQNDYVKVEGDFVTESNQNHFNYLTKGVFEVKGDFTQIRYNNNANFRASENHKLILSGEALQKINFESSSDSSHSHINNLEIRNTSEDGVEFVSNVFITGEMKEISTPISGGKKIYIGQNTQLNWDNLKYNIAINKTFDLQKDMKINGSLYIDGGSVSLNGYSLKVEGNLIHERGTLDIDGGELIVKGDYRIQRENIDDDGDVSYEDSFGELRMNNDDDYIYVGGDFVAHGRNQERGYLTAGTLEIKGDFTQSRGSWSGASTENFKANKNHRTILSGSEIQRITFNNPRGSQFNELVITKPMEKGYRFNTIPVWNVLIEDFSDRELPTVPQNLRVIENSITTVSLKWDISLDDVDVEGYEIFRNGLRVGTSRTNRYIDQRLMPNTKYTYTIKAYDVYGNYSEHSESVGITTNVGDEPPEVPQNLSISSRTDTSVSLSWSPSTGNVPVEGYKVYLNGIHIGDSENTRYTDTDLEPGTHHYTIKAFDTSGNISNSSNAIIYDNEPPTAPKDVSVADITATSVTLNWSESQDNIGVLEYEVFRDGVRIGVTDSLTYKDNTLEPMGEYTYVVRAKDFSWNVSQPSKSITVSTYIDDEPPTTPKELRVASQTGSSITLTWDASVDNVGVKGYEIYRDDEYIGTSKTLQYKDEKLLAGTSYTYSVKAFDAAGNYSDKSSEIIGIPMMPRIIETEPVDEETIGGENKRMHVYFVDSGNMQGSDAVFEYSEDGSTWVEFENIVYGPYRTRIEGENIIRFYSDWNLEPLSSGEYMVRYTVYDDDGNNDERVVSYNVNRTSPKKVENINAVSDSSGITLTWDIAADGDVSYYNIYRSVNEPGSFTLLERVDERTTVFYRDSDILPETNYYYFIRAVDVFEQESSNSEVIEATTVEDTVPPTILGISPVDETTMGKSAQITVRAEDNIAVSSITLQYFDNLEEEWIDIETIDTSAVANFTWSDIPVSEEVKVRAIAKDTSGNISDGTPVRTYYIDTEGPEKITGLNASAYTTNIILRWNDVSDDDFAYFSVEKKESLNDSYEKVGTVDDTLGMNVTGLDTETTYNFRVVAYDVYGNKGTYSDELEVSTTKDTEPPVIASLEPEPGYYANVIPLEGSAVDNVGVTAFVFEISEDMENWSDIEKIELGDAPKTANVSYDFDVSSYDDGTYYVRGRAYDEAGNVSTCESFVEYRIDCKPPKPPSGMVIENNKGNITIAWDRSEDTSVMYYRLYRAEDSQGPYTVIAEKLSSLGYIDRSVKMDKTYYYKVSAISATGIVSEKTNSIEAGLNENTGEPEIINMSPSDGSNLPANPTIQILAVDNYKLSEVMLEYNDGDDWVLIGSEELDVYGKVVAFTWDTTDLTNGAYTLRARAVNSEGNESEYYIVNYQLNTEPPMTPQITVEPGDWTVDLSWTTGNEEDLAGFYVYRSTVSGGSHRRIKSLTDTSFTDTLLMPGQSYYYVVEAIDIFGNVSRSSEVAAIPGDDDPYPPVADAGEDRITTVGAEVLFDGRASSDNDRIESYHWDFGDGNTGVGATPLHTYSEEGTYEVTLTVFDPSGNSDKDTIKVTVRQEHEVGVLEVRVIDDATGEPISGASVYVDFPDDQPSQFITDSQGRANVVGNSGNYNIAAYMEGYLPRDTNLQINQHQNSPVTIGITKGELVVGDLNVRRMELDEIVNAGIDINAPENQYVYEFEVELEFERRELPKLNITANGHGGILRVGFAGGSGGFFRLPGGGRVYPKVIPNSKPEIPPTIAYLVIPGEISWLKEFFEVSLTMTNMADPQFVIEDASVKLDLPEGLSLAPTRDRQSLKVDMGSIEGGETKDAQWIIRGDQKGSYNLEADFTGTLMPFNHPVNTIFKTEEPFEVLAEDALHLSVTPQGRAYIGEKYNVTFQLTNTSNFPVYNLNFEVDGEPVDTPNFHRITGEETDSQHIGPGDIIEVSTLMPGESIWFEYETVINFEGDPSKHYYVLTNTSIDGRGMQIPTTVNPPSDGSDDPEEDREGDVSGIVWDKDEDVPVSGASVLIGSNTTVTDVDGRFSFEGINLNNNELTVNAESFHEKVKEVELRDGAYIRIELSQFPEIREISSAYSNSNDRRASMVPLNLLSGPIKFEINTDLKGDGYVTDYLYRVVDKYGNIKTERSTAATGDSITISNIRSMMTSGDKLHFAVKTMGTYGEYTTDYVDTKLTTVCELNILNGIEWDDDLEGSRQNGVNLNLGGISGLYKFLTGGKDLDLSFPSDSEIWEPISLKPPQIKTDFSVNYDFYNASATFKNKNSLNVGLSGQFLDFEFPKLGGSGKGSMGITPESKGELSIDTIYNSIHSRWEIKSISYTSESGVTVDISFKYTVPADLKFGGLLLSAYAEVKVQGQYVTSMSNPDISNLDISTLESLSDLIPEIQTTLSIALRLAVGAQTGYGLASGEIFGKGELSSVIPSWRTELTLSYGGKYGYLWFFSNSTTWGTKTWVLNEGSDESGQAGTMSSFDFSALSIEDEELTFNSRPRDYLEHQQWIGEELIVEAAYPDSNAQISPVDESIGDLIMIFTGDDSERTDNNRTAVYSSIYSDKKWSEPIQIDNDGTGDALPYLAVDGEDIYATWLDMSEEIGEMSDDITENYITENILGKMGVTAAKYNKDSKDWENIYSERIDGVNKHPQIATKNGETMVTWVNNKSKLSIGNTLNPDNVYYAYNDGDGWTEADIFVKDAGNVYQSDLLMHKDRAYYVFVTNAYSEDETYKLYLTTFDGSSWSDPVGIIDNSLEDSHPVITLENNEPVVFWQNGESIYKSSLEKPDDAQEIIDSRQSSGILELSVTDTDDGSALSWTNAMDGEYRLYVSTYDEGSSTWTQGIEIEFDSMEVPKGVTLAEFEDSVMAVYNIIPYKFDEENEMYYQEFSSLTSTLYRRKTDLAILEDGIYFKEDIPLPGEDAKATVEVVNLGDVTVDSFTVSLYDDEQLIGAKDIENAALSHGESKSIDLDLTVSEDSNGLNLKAVLELEKDSNLSNNTAKLNVSYTDAEITGVYNELYTNNTGVIYVDVKNSGYSNIRDAKVYLSTESEFDNIFDSITIDQLKPQQEKRVKFDLELEQELDMKFIYAKVEVEQDEFNYLNNVDFTVLRSVNVTEQPEEPEQPDESEEPGDSTPPSGSTPSGPAPPAPAPDQDDDDDDEDTSDEDVVPDESESKEDKKDIKEPEPDMPSAGDIRYIRGYEDNTFRPENGITRAEMSVILANLDEASKDYLEEVQFEDVSNEHWASWAISYATDKGYFKGYEDNTFRPDRHITRAELSVVLCNYMGIETYVHESYSFEDITGHWAEDFINRLVSRGHIKGYPDDTFRPDNNVKRSECVSLINRILGIEPVLDEEPYFSDVDKDYWAFGDIMSAIVR